MGRSDRDVMALSDTKIKIPGMDELTNFFMECHEQELLDLANLYPEKNSFYLDFHEVGRFSRGLEDALINAFIKVEPILKKAIIGTDFFRIRDDKESIEKTLILRVRGLPAYYKQAIRDLGRKDVGHVVCFDGFARMVSDSEPIFTKTAFECLRCGHVTVVYQSGTKFEEPFAGCENETCGKKGPFNIDPMQSEYKDFQRLQIQELPDASRGTKTRDIIVEVDEELCNTIEPGDKVTVTGLLQLVQRTGRDGKKNLNEKIIKALSIEKQDRGFDEVELTKDEEEEILELSRDPEVCEKIRASIAPSIYGNETIKEAAGLILFSGVRKVLPDGTVYRGDEHMFLIGDPGNGKSQLLRWLVKVSPRGVFTSGKTASAAGLTAAAVKDPLNDGRWTLEGGAAVMANRGLLAIDEFNQAREEDKSALHEGLEQQTISVSKAGIIATMQAQFTCVAAGNPENGYFDRGEPFADQLKIPPALLSRFGLIFVMLDEPDPDRDEAISGHILTNHAVGAAIVNNQFSKNPIYSEAEIRDMSESIACPIPEELLKKYIAYSKMHVFPVTPSEVRARIKEFYVSIRKMKVYQTCPVPITARDVEALQRLSEARARMRLSDVVEIQDVEHAKKIIIASLRDVGFDPETGMPDASIKMCGKSQSRFKKEKDQKEKIKILYKVIMQNGDPEAITAEMERVGVAAEDTEKMIKSLKGKGQVFFTGQIYKIVK